MKHIVKKLTGLALLALCSANAAVQYVGNTADADVTTVIDLSSNPTATYGGTYTAATSTQPAVWTWPSTTTFVLQEIIFIRNGNVYIEPGSVVRGQPDGGTFNPGALAFARGAKLIAPGSVDSPIIFTSASTAETPTRAAGVNPTFWDSAPKTAPKAPTIAGHWGGVLLCGNAPVNSDRDGAGVQDYFDITGNTGAISNGTAVSGNRSVSNDDRFSIEGIPTSSAAFTGGYDRFGGFNVSDNSGVLTYVSIRHGGANLSSNNEINGLTLGGVGSNTIVNHIEIWGNTDDGVEIFGGTVNLDHIVIVAPQDDGLDLDVGYTGTVQYLLVVASGNTDRVAEWDGSYRGETSINGGTYATGPTSPSLSLIANFLVANATFIGNSATKTASASSSAFYVRDQAAPRLLNSFIINPVKGMTIGSSGSLQSSGPLEIDIRSGITDSTSTTNLFVKGVAFLKGVTIFDSTGTYTTATTLIDNCTDSATMRTELAKAVYQNIFDGDPGFVNLPSGGTLPSTLALDPRPTANSDSFFEDEIVATSGAYESTSYRGAFDPAASNLWTATWTASATFGLLVQ
jgi:hypothetical protein